MSADKTTIQSWIQNANTYLGIEFGSTRIKAVLIGDDYSPIAQGNHDWENRLTDGIWTYTLDDVWEGIRDAYANLKADVLSQYGETLTNIGGIGISAMMHGYLAFDKEGNLLVPFRTWRNTITGPASEELTKLFHFAIPQRWSIAHLYQAILNKEEHVKDISYLTTLDAYVHWMLTGEKVTGIGDAAGMFPIDSKTLDYDANMLKKFNDHISSYGFSWNLSDILPKVLPAGTPAGVLTSEGALRLDPSGDLRAGISLCPPEGDAGTGMVATNSVRVRTGNVSAGTSVFAMVVLEHALKKAHSEIDMVTTPSGEAVAMVHCNNCTSDLNAWVHLFGEFAELSGNKLDPDKLYGLLYNKALEGDADCGGLLAYNYFSGEHITGLSEGRPLFVRHPDDNFSLSNFMRTHLYTSLGALKTGLDILFKEEQIEADMLLGHGGLFKTKGVGQQVMADATGLKVKVMETAGEGGAWGCALLAAYAMKKENGETLADYLDHHVFKDSEGVILDPSKEGMAGFNAFMKRYAAGLSIEKAAVESI